MVAVAVLRLRLPCSTPSMRARRATRMPRCPGSLNTRATGRAEIIERHRKRERGNILVA